MARHRTGGNDEETVFEVPAHKPDAADLCARADREVAVCLPPLQISAHDHERRKRQDNGGEVMEQDMQQNQKRATKLVSFRISPDDARDVKEAAAQQRTNVSSIIRGALLDAGVIKNNQGDGEAKNG